MKFSKILLFVSLAVLLSAPAFAWEPWVDNYDPPCWDDPDACSMQYTSPSGTAPGMVTCVSNQGCKVCYRDDVTIKLRCGTAYMRDGNCKCQVVVNEQNFQQCNMEGQCTFRK